MEHTVTVSGFWCTDGTADVGVECTCSWTMEWRYEVPFKEMASAIAQHIGD